MVSECKQIPVDGRTDGRGPEAEEEEEEEAPLLCARGGSRRIGGHGPNHQSQKNKKKIRASQ